MKSIMRMCICALVAACGSESEAPREPTVGTEIASDYNRQMNRARGAGLELERQKRELDAAIEASDPENRGP